MNLKDLGKASEGSELPPLTSLDRRTNRKSTECRQNSVYSPRACLDVIFQFSDDSSSNWTEAKPLEIVVTVKMFNLDHFRSNSVKPAKMTTTPTEYRDSLLISQESEKDELRQLLLLISRD